MSPDIPIVCRLTDAQLQERRQTVLRQLALTIQETQELPNGYAYRFPTGDATLEELTSLIRFERQCCPFLTFRLTAEPNDGPLWLEVTGPGETKEFLASLWE
jgi:hypothetical protein